LTGNPFFCAVEPVFPQAYNNTASLVKFPRREDGSMLENLLDSLNRLLSQHPHLLDAMRFLFVFKCWLLLGVFLLFVYLVYADGQALPKKKPAKPAPKGVFIA
jgi:hypothetical protein